jgi:hypothetical protein
MKGLVSSVCVVTSRSSTIDCTSSISTRMNCGVSLYGFVFMCVVLSSASI